MNKYEKLRLEESVMHEIDGICFHNFVHLQKSAIHNISAWHLFHI